MELGNEFAYLFFFEASDGLLDYSAAVLHLVRYFGKSDTIKYEHKM